jgi:hypothetical protein
MHEDEARISVSVATIELVPADGGTKLTCTEQGAFLDGLAQAADRQQGITEQLDNLTGFLATEAQAGEGA